MIEFVFFVTLSLLTTIVNYIHYGRKFYSIKFEFDLRTNFIRLKDILQGRLCKI